MNNSEEIKNPVNPFKASLLARLLLVLAIVSSIFLLSRTPGLLGRQHRASSSRVAFLYLAASFEKDIADLNCSLKSVQANFNERYGYRVIVMHEDINQDIQEDLSTRFPVEFKQVNLELDQSINKSYHYPTSPSSTRRSTWGYQNMCRFWFTGIFRNSSVLEGLDYYVRLDTDSLFTSKVENDFIREFIEDGVSYGHYALQNDCGDVVTGLRDLALSYAESNLEVAGPSRWKHVVDPWNGNRCVPLYYNNLEFVDIRRFQEDEGIRKWETEVDKNGGIYRHRWGDAPLRYITTAMFFRDDEVKLFNVTGYVHKFKREACLR